MLYRVGLRECLQSLTELLEELGRVAKHHAERVLIAEARAWNAEHVLLLEKFLAERDVVLDVRELLEIDADHHVDRALRLRGRDAFDTLHRVECRISCSAELLVKAFEEGVRNGL